MSKLVISPLSIAALSLLLAACGGLSESPTPSSTSTVRADQYCKFGNFEPSLRQTFILIDAKQLKRSEKAEEFTANNSFVRDLVFSFANPQLALVSGMSDARERISILVVPTDGSPAQLVFSGCIPGLSPEEEAIARQGSSSIGEFLTGDKLKDLTKAGEKFQLEIVRALISSAKTGSKEQEPQTGKLGSTTLFSSIRSSSGILETPKGMVSRFVIVSDLSAVSFEDEAPEGTPYKKGLDAGYKAGGDFGLSEVLIVQPQGSAVKGKDFLEGFLLAQGANLVSYSSGKPLIGGRAPKQVRVFEGEADYPSKKENLILRIADDGKGRLSSSWLSILGSTNQPIPMTGQITCSSSRTCKIVSDDKGFAQAWSSRASAEPEFSNELPFGGMRNFSFQIEGVELNGTVSDPMVQIGPDASNNSIRVRATAR